MLIFSYSYRKIKEIANFQLLVPERKLLILWR